MADYTEQQLIGALRKADAAGDEAAARVIARRIQSMRQAPQADFSNVQSGADTVAGPSPTDGMSGGEKFLAGIGKSMADTYRGAKQLGTMGLRHVAGGGSANPAVLVGNMLTGTPQAPGQNAVTQFADRSLATQQADIDRSRRMDAPLMDTGAGLAGNVVGTISQIMGPGIALKGTAAGAALLPRTVAGNALQGGVLGAAQPTATGDSRLANIALGTGLGAAGAALPILGGRLASLVRGAPYTASGASQRAGQILAREATDPASLMRPQPSAVPGVNRTLGEQSLDPGVMALENTLRAGQRAIFDPIDTANNVARVQGLQRIAGTEADMAAAEAARGTTARAAREQAMQAGPVALDNTLASIESAIQGQQGRPAVQGALRQVQSLLQNADGTPESRIAVLDNVRMTIGDMLSGKYGGESAASLKGSRELIAIRDALNDEIGSQVPAFTDYLNAYRTASKPINRMQVGQELLERGSAPVPDDLGLPRLTPGAFSRVSGDLDQVASRATGFGKANAASILSKDDIGLIKAIQDDMQRQFRRQSSATVGSQTFERGEIEKRLGRSLASRIPVVGGFMEAFDQAATQRVKERLAYMVANPDEARAVLAALPPADRAVVNQALLQLTARPAAAAPALVSD